MKMLCKLPEVILEKLPKVRDIQCCPLCHNRVRGTQLTAVIVEGQSIEMCCEVLRWLQQNRDRCEFCHRLL